MLNAGHFGNTCERAVQQLQILPAFYDAVPVGLCLIDRNLRLVSINRCMAEMAGRPAGTAIGHRLAEIMPGVAVQLEAQLQKALQGEQAADLEIRATRMGWAGEDRAFLVSCAPTRGEDGEIAGALCSVLDVTERKRTEAALRESEDDHRHTVGLSPHISWTADPEGKILEVSPRGSATFGLPREAMVGDGWLEVIHPDDRAGLLKVWSDVLRSGAPLDAECRIRPADGCYRWVRSRAAPRRDAQGRILRWYGTLEDVHDRKLAEAALAESEAAFRRLFHSNPAPMWVYDRETLRFLEVNDAAVQVYGWSREAFLGMTILDIRPADERENVRQAATEGRAPRKVSGPWRHMDAHGRERLVHAMSYLIEFAGRPGALVTAWDVTDRVRAQEALRESEENYRHTIELSPQIPWVADADGQVIAISPRWGQLVGMAHEETLGMGWLAAIHPDDVSRMEASWTRAMTSGEPLDVESRFCLKGGGYRWFRTRAAARRDETGRIIRWYGTDEDIHERKLAEEALRESEEFSRGVLEGTTDCVKILDLDGRLLFVNGPGLALMEIEDFTAYRGCRWTSLLPDEVAAETNLAFEAARAGRPSHFSVFCPTVKGTPKWWEVVVSPIFGAGGKVVRFLSISRDISERRAAEQRISHLAHHDPLTDLANRRLFHQELEKALAGLRPGEQLALHCLDLDHFKGVNDALGHPAGDALLLQVAERLRGCTGDGNLVARMAGDEFAVIQTGLRGPEEAAALARRIVECLGEDYQIDGKHVGLGASVGMALAPDDGARPEELVRNADIALYRAKAGGRGTFRFFERQMDKAVRRKQELKAGLHAALDRGELELHFQPLVGFDRCEVTCFEALLRWHHPVLGPISPTEFIPLAEESGLIMRMGEWALRTACREAARWPRAIRVAVNLSPVQFRTPGLLQAVADALAKSGLAASRLELEITESVLLQDDEVNLQILRDLRGLGVRVALDDFGTGFSSLGYLLRFPFDKIKIDRSFVQGLPDREEAKAIISAIIGMGRGLGISVTAEGVETAGQFITLRGKGCSEAQGYLFSAPVPAAEVPALLDRLRPSGCLVA
ncbi:MAG TPA: PAS domain S-box protein [Roseomonas sp.]